MLCRLGRPWLRPQRAHARAGAVQRAVRWAVAGIRAVARGGTTRFCRLSCAAGTWMGLGLTLVDGLDTLILAEMDKVRCWS